ncbi:sensor histidine kinase [Methanobacterium oryzae]|uniref:sensor histidine kinase n=1 Tax=Methanobacterium oryzae TaxID=69540 RepID=UPI003D21A960
MEEVIKFKIKNRRLLSFNNTVIVGITTISIFVFFSVFINNLEFKTVFSDGFAFIINVFTVIALFFAAKYSKSFDKNSYKAWLLLALAQLSLVIGDLLWSILEFSLNQNPRFSIVNLFYLIYYVLFTIGILILPKFSIKYRERIVKLIEIEIIMISAFFLSLIFFMEPLIQIINENTILSVIPLIWVFLDFFLFFALLDLLFNWLRQINRLPYLILDIGILIKVIIDFIYLYQFINRPYITWDLLNLGWIISSIFIILAAVTHINDKKIDINNFFSKYIHYLKKIQFNVYMPILLLSIVYILFIWSDYNSNSENAFLLEIFFGIILLLAISHQAISFKGNREQYLAAKKEIEKRKIIEAKLNKVLSNLDKEVQERTKEQEKLIEELKRSNKELEVFAYVASHDLQEPLRTIASFTQLLERRYKGQLDDDADEFIDFIIDGSKRMKQLILDLLEYSRVTTKGQEFIPVNTKEILDYVLNNLNTLIAENKVIITLDNLPTITADKGQLTRVFQNLISNSIKFRKADEQPKIQISYEEKENEHFFSVSDNGIGIEKQYFNRIFTIFQRLHTIKEYSGTGIGLSVTKRIIERHGGRIWVESSFGKGSTFYFTIPKSPCINHLDSKIL